MEGIRFGIPAFEAPKDKGSEASEDMSPGDKLVELAPEGWMTTNYLVGFLNDQGLKVYYHNIKTIVKPFRKTHPEWFKMYKNVDGTKREYYSPELIRIVHEKVQDRQKVSPRNWFKLADIERLLQEKGLEVTRDRIKNVSIPYKKANPKWFRKYKDQTGNLRLHYSLELVDLITNKLKEREGVPENFLSSNEVVELLKEKGKKVSSQLVKDIADQYRTSHPSYFFEYEHSSEQKWEYYSPELVSVVIANILAREIAPSKWLTTNGLRKLLRSKGIGTSARFVNNKVDRYRASHPEWFKEYEDSTGKLSIHYSPELVELIVGEMEYHQQSRLTSETRLKHQEQLKKQFESFLQEISTGESSQAQEVQKLISLFGSSNIIDILYRYRPEFKGLRTEYVQSALARYLGDFLVLQTSFNFNNLDFAPRYLSEQSFQEALFEVIKSDCLAFYHQQRIREKSNDTDEEIIERYITLTQDKVATLDSTELEEIIKRVREYFRSLLHNFEKPSHIVDSLQGDRQFPDLNQKLNIQEIASKKRLLIADQMGLGKSASVILTKEYLGVKKALVVVPANVIATWQTYLSDKVGEDGKQLGYFKSGQAPRIVTVNSISDVERIDGDACDYILISQERLDQSYSEALKSVGYEMLIVDEVHKVKNLQSGKRAEEVVNLADFIKEDGYLALLSGTPAPNTIKDVAMILRLLYSDLFAHTDERSLVSNIINGELIDLRNLLIPRMQMKELKESIVMPEMTERIALNKLSKDEQEIYELLLEDDELTANQKIRAFRKMVMNPSALEISPDVASSKVANIAKHLNSVFESKKKVVMFVNDYIEGIVRGTNTIFEELDIPQDVDIKIIEGSISPEERRRIQEELFTTDQKILLVVSGQTADVGVDFSSAEHVVFYNEPWTLYDKQQQTGRVYRPGLKNNLEVVTSITEGTIEEGIHEYIELKYRAIQKLLQGVPITEIEKNILRSAEKQAVPEIEADVQIAQDWLDSPQNRLHRFFGFTKEIGEEGFHKFLLEHGEEYAKSYLEIGPRGFQANTARVSGSMIEHFVRERETSLEDIIILDVASGPRMLETHIADELKEHVNSLDINPLHFGSEVKNTVVGSFLNIPFPDAFIDYVNLSQAFHYTRFLPGRGDYERVALLSELNRILKPGGRAVINLIYSLELRDSEKLSHVMQELGFKIVPEYTGHVNSGGSYSSFYMVLEKERSIEDDVETLVGRIGKENYGGIKLKESKIKLKDSRHIINEFSINGEIIPITLNTEDAKLLEEQKIVFEEGTQLITEYGSVKEIPKQEIINRGFLRINNGSYYRLYKKSDAIGGFVKIA